MSFYFPTQIKNAEPLHGHNLFEQNKQKKTNEIFTKHIPHNHLFSYQLIRSPQWSSTNGITLIISSLFFLLINLKSINSDSRADNVIYINNCFWPICLGCTLTSCYDGRGASTHSPQPSNQLDWLTVGLTRRLKTNAKNRNTRILIFQQLPLVLVGSEARVKRVLAADNECVYVSDRLPRRATSSICPKFWRNLLIFRSMNFAKVLAG